MLTKLVRIGRDAELRTTQSGTQVLSFPAVYDVGFGENKKGQWLDVAMFGQKAEKLQQYFVKGTQIVIYADDVCIHEYQKNDGTNGVKLQCKLVNFDFAGGQAKQPAPQQQQQQQAPQQQQAGGLHRQQQQPAQQAQANGADWDDDLNIPF